MREKSKIQKTKGKKIRKKTSSEISLTLGADDIREKIRNFQIIF